MVYDNLSNEDRRAMEEAEEGYNILMQAVVLAGTDGTKSVAERVRAIANTDHPWIPGAQADLIREIADELEILEKIREVLRG